MESWGEKSPKGLNQKEKKDKSGKDREQAPERKKKTTTKKEKRERSCDGGKTPEKKKSALKTG